MFESIFPNLLGFVFFWIFLSLAKQAPGLFGSEGISPIVDFMTILKNRYFSYPTIYWFNQSDRFISATLWLGVILSVLLTFGFFPLFTLAALLVLYFSILLVGLDFTNFSWQSTLFEFSLYFLLFLISPNKMIWWNLNFLLFRFYFIGGICKLESKDPEWRNLKALHYHYLTQSIPTKLAWYAMKWPLWISRLFTLSVLIIEILGPFLMFETRARVVAFILFSSLQIGIWLLGNFGTLNLMSLVMGFILLFQVEPTEGLFLSGLGMIFLISQGLRFLFELYPTHLFKEITAPLTIWHFRAITRFYNITNKKRIEVVVEGSEDGIDWKEYIFYWKPCEVDQFPPRSAPYITHLERNMVYLSKSNEIGWFLRFIDCLLLNSKPVLSLLKTNPFPDSPPKFIRSSLYEYTFTASKEEGWWDRTYLAPFTSDVICKRENREEKNDD